MAIFAFRLSEMPPSNCKQIFLHCAQKLTPQPGVSNSETSGASWLGTKCGFASWLNIVLLLEHIVHRFDTPNLRVPVPAADFHKTETPRAHAITNTWRPIRAA